MASGKGSNVALLTVGYGATFAIITVALISGAIADRAKFGPWMVFVGVFATLVYFPVAAWVWGGGWIMHLGEALFGVESGIEFIDYAGGTAVHINAGAAALALAIVLGKRDRLPEGHAEAAQRAAHAARRLAAVVRLVRLQRRCAVDHEGMDGVGLDHHQHVRRGRRRHPRLDPGRADQGRQGHLDRRRIRRRRRPRRDHPRLHHPHAGLGAGPRR